MRPRPRIAYSIIPLALLLAAAGTSALSWGTNGHAIVTSNAIVILPKELKPFYKANSNYIVPLSDLPDDWKDTHRNEERANHYINLDKLADPPFSKLIMSRSAAVKRFGKAKLREAGFLPWVIAQRYAKLVKAFKNKDMVEIVVQSSLLAHYVADAHVPLHATRHYDGKTPRQKRLHSRWEVELLERHAVRVNPEPAQKVTKILTSAFHWCISSWKQTDAIFRAEDRAHKIGRRRSTDYYDSLFQLSGHILKGRLESAAEALAGVYVAAWTEAGKPKLPNKCAPLFWGH